MENLDLNAVARMGLILALLLAVPASLHWLEFIAVWRPCRVPWPHKMTVSACAAFPRAAERPM